MSEKVRRSTADYEYGIVGEHSYQDHLSHLRRTGEEVFEVLLRREPTNPYDPWAVAAIVNGLGTIGYLRKGDAHAVAEELDRLDAAGYIVSCEGKLMGGRPPDKPDFGVILDLDFDSLLSPPNVTPTFAPAKPPRWAGVPGRPVGLPRAGRHRSAWFWILVVVMVLVALLLTLGQRR